MGRAHRGDGCVIGDVEARGCGGSEFDASGAREARAVDRDRGAAGRRSEAWRNTGDAPERAHRERPRVVHAIDVHRHHVLDAGLQRGPGDDDHGAAAGQVAANRGDGGVDDAVRERDSVAGE